MPDYVSTLEVSLKEKDDECAALRLQLDSHRSEINDLRQRLGMPLVPSPTASSESGALGLLVPPGTWGDVKDIRREVGS